MIEADTKPDLKEGYYVSRDLPLDYPQVVAKKFAHGPNIWPTTMGAHFRETCMDYLERVTNLTEQVMQAIAVSLGYDVHYFDEFCHEPMAFYKLLHYPPQRDDAHKLQRGIGAHRDFGVITLLLQGDIPGLEVWDAEANDWYPAPPVEGAYVVNLGNLFEQWSNDKYISNIHVSHLHLHPFTGFQITNTPHSVSSTVLAATDIPSHSTTMYLAPPPTSSIYPFSRILTGSQGNPDFIIKCIESCRQKEEDEKYAPVSVEDYVRQKYKDVYGRVGIYTVAEKVM